MPENKTQTNQTQTKNKIKLLWVSDYNVPTGYGEVSENILHRLDPEKYEIQVLACNYTGIKPVFPAKFPVWGSHSAYALNELLTVFDEFQPDILVTMNDGYVMPFYYQVLGKRLDKCKWVSYVVFDGAPIDMWPGALKFIDAVVVPTQWQKEILEKVGVRSAVISHGVDIDIFKPLTDKEKREYKISLLGEKMADRFVFGMVAKNFSRKRFSELIYAFKTFKYDMGIKFSQEPLLVLYATGKDAANLDLATVCNRVGLKTYDTAIIKPPDERGLSAEEMNKMYNLFDVNCLISVGEGFGLPIINAAACGKTSIVIDNTVMPYHAKIFPMMLCKPLAQPMFFERNNTAVCYLPDCKTLAAVLEVAYNEMLEPSLAERREERFKRALEASNKLQWKNIVPEFDKIFESLSKVNKGAIAL